MGSGVSIPVGVDDNATGPVDRIRDRFDRLGNSGAVKSFTQGLGMGAGIGVFNMAVGAIQGVASAMGDMVTAAVDDAANVSRLQRTLDNSAPSWRANASAIDQRIAAGQKLAFTDDQIRDSLNSLVPRTKNVNEALKLQALAMDLARAKGIDLGTASNLIGKVYNGNVGILARYGIAVDKGATSTEALAAIQKMAAGQAETYGKSTKGSMESLGIAFSEIGESIGAALLPVLQALIPIIRDKVVPIVMIMAKVLGAVLEALSPLIGFIADIAIATFQAFANIVLTVGEVLLSVAAAIPGPWQQGATEMRDAITKMKDDINSLSTDATSVAADTGPAVGGALAAGADDVGEGTDAMMDPMVEGVQGAGVQAAKATEKSLSAIIGSIRSAKDEFVSAWKSALDASRREQEVDRDLSTNIAEQKKQRKIIADKDTTAAARREAKIRLADLQGEHAALLAEQSTFGDTQTQIARTKGLLTSKAMADGLRSGDADIRQYWSTLKDATEKRLGELEGTAEQEGYNAAHSFGRGLGGKQARGQVKGAAGDLADTARTTFKTGITDKADDWGHNVSVAYGNGLASSKSIRHVVDSVHKVISAISPYIKALSPPKEGPLRDIGKWGETLGETWSDAVAKGAQSFRLPTSISAAAGSAPTGGSFAGLAMGGGPTVIVNIDQFYGDSNGIAALSREIGWQVRLSTVKGVS